jgi:sulfoxide reductase heme-binding subunit YedZ
LPGSRYLVWIVLSVPGLYWLQGYWRETHFYGELVHSTGVLATQLLILTLAITPLQRVLPRFAWLGWLRRRRRYLGVAAFGYSFLHAAIYFERQETFARILEDAQAIAMWTGWLALLLMLVLAATSNDQSMRWLGRRWRLLHRLVYLAAALTFAHWILSAFDPTTGYMYLAVLVAFEGVRLVSLAVRRPSAARPR